MLNGIAPILIFSFPVLPAGTFSAFAGIPFVGEAISQSTALPIPLYLDEKLTGIFIDSESKNIDLQTEVDSNSTGTTPDVTQRAVASTVTINMKALKTSPVFNALVGLIDLAFQKAIAKGYTVSYLNGPTTVFNAKIDSFAVNTDADNELMILSVVINQSGKVTNQVKAITAVEKVTVGV